MLSVELALEKLLATVTSFPASEVPLRDAAGLCLADDVDSTADSPPFDKSSMDGYAVRSQDVLGGVTDLRVIELITAGQVPGKSVGPGEAAQIMTGAPMPRGADTVIKVEDTQRSGDIVSIGVLPPRAGLNVMLRGTSLKVGDRVLNSGQILTGARIGALAEMGRTLVPVRRRPKVAVLATGNELVPIDVVPGPGQIRNSNMSMLVAQIEAAGALAVPLGIARDERDELRSRIEQGLQCDILALTGGVSAGTLDLVPSVLSELGVREIFHKVEMKPGKPIWFGEWTSGGTTAHDRKVCHVFGLPGNPVSSLVCCELFVRTAIRRLMGIDPPVPQPLYAKLEHEYSSRSDRPTYHPAKLNWSAHGLSVSLVPWHGSSDLCGTATANGMALIPPEARQYKVDELLQTYAW